MLVLYALIVLVEDLQHFGQSFDSPASDGVWFALDSVLASITVGMVAWRSTWAFMVSLSCLATSLLIENFITALFAVSVVTVSVLATATDRFVALALVVYSGWIVVIALVQGGASDAVFWTCFVILLLSCLIGAGVRHSRQQRRRNEQRVRDLEVLNQRLREDERMALARDLHDVVAHELTLITLQTMSRRRSEDVGQLHGVLETVEDAARSALQELRVLLQLLRNENEDEHPRDVTGAGLAIGSLEHVVTSLAASLQDLSFEPDVVVTGDLEAMPTTVRGTAARILQEAVTNIIKYAPRGSRCRIEVTADDHELRLLVTNPLPWTTKPVDGTLSELSSGLGLRGIAERVSLLGGRSTSGPEGGQWVLRVSLPVDRQEAL